MNRTEIVKYHRWNIIGIAWALTWGTYDILAGVPAFSIIMVLLLALCTYTLIRDERHRRYMERLRAASAQAVAEFEAHVAAINEMLRQR